MRLGAERLALLHEQQKSAPRKVIPMLERKA